MEGDTRNKMKMEKYNTRVRQAISERYVVATKEKCKLSKEYEDIFVRLQSGEEKDKLSYNKYIELEQKADELNRKISELKIEINIWDQAREICLNIADEMF